jgi:hypothetical protein
MVSVVTVVPLLPVTEPAAWEVDSGSQMVESLKHSVWLLAPKRVTGLSISFSTSS